MYRAFQRIALFNWSCFLFLYTLLLAHLISENGEAIYDGKSENKLFPFDEKLLILYALKTLYIRYMI